MEGIHTIHDIYPIQPRNEPTYRSHKKFEQPSYPQHDYWTQVHQLSDSSPHSRKRRDEDRHYMKRSQSPIQFEDIDNRPFSRNSNGPELRSSHIGVLSSQVEDLPFSAKTYRSSYRPPAGTKAVPRARRFQELSDTEPVDTEEEPKVVSLGDEDYLQTIG